LVRAVRLAINRLHENLAEAVDANSQRHPVLRGCRGPIHPRTTGGCRLVELIQAEAISTIRPVRTLFAFRWSSWTSQASFDKYFNV